MSSRENRRHGGLVGPVILIGLGIIFLLNNLGYLSWSVWETLFRLWPILLVAAGLDLILGQRSIWGSVLALVLTFGVLGLALWLSGTDFEVGRTTRSQSIVQPLGEVDQVELVINPRIGRLSIEAAPDSDNLVEGTVYLVRQESLTRSFDVEDGRGSFVLRGEAGAFGPFAAGWGRQRSWDLQLSPDVPLQLETDLDIGEQRLDLTGLRVDGLQVDHGIGQTTVILPDEGRFQARIEGAIGQTVIVIPRALAARVRLNTGISGRQLPASYLCENDVCVSPDYETADHRVDLEVSQAIGNIVIRH